MNKYLKHLTNRVTFALIGAMSLVAIAIILHWNMIMIPVIKMGEQTKADLLIAPYAEILEQAIDQGQGAQIDETLNRLALLIDPRLQKPMVLRIKVTLVSGEVYEKQNEKVTDYQPFLAETPLFSPTTHELRGAVQLEYSGELFHDLTTDAEKRLVFTILAVMLLLVVVQRHVSRLLDPLNAMATHLQSIDFSDPKPLPSRQRNISLEIKQVWDAVDQLFLKLQQRDKEVYQEHEAAQEALKQQLKAESANKAKSQFLANMSHELRTPLNAIIGYSEMLKEEVEEHRQPLHFSDDLERIRSAGKHLLSLINDVLDLSKVEAGKMQLYFEDVKVGQLINEVVDTIKPMALRNRNEIDVSCPDGIGSITVDMSKLRQTLLNLLSNAVKFTSDGKVSVNVSRNFDNDMEWIYFAIKDTGIGLTQEQIRHLFVAFSQADESTTREYGGTGLGLTISRSFSRLMGGDISVESEIGVGSTFTLKLPIGVMKHVELEPEPEPPESDNVYQYNKRLEHSHRNVSIDRRKKKSLILIIDDDPMGCDIPRRYLEKEGYTVECAADGVEGINKINEVHPDIVLLDVMLPGMSGWQVLSYVKKQPALVHIPVIMLTMIDEKSTAYSLGATYYLSKPIDKDELSKVINRCVRKEGLDSVLVVDDNADARKLVRLILENEGFSVVEAENGYLGLMRVAERRPALILLDLVMPGMSGEQFLTELDKRENWREIPVIALTGVDMDDNAIIGIGKRVEKVIQKGAYSIDQVLTEVREIMNVRDTQHQAISDDNV